MWVIVRRMKSIFRILVCVVSLITTFAPARADRNYSQQVFFDNSLSPECYFYSRGKAVAPSSLKLIGRKLPIETDSFISGPNALLLQWRSVADGGWPAEVRLYGWRNRMLDFPGANLWLCP